jgi:ubiquinone/menaquinone biosynthesis C-methylase UbiE
MVQLNGYRQMQWQLPFDDSSFDLVVMQFGIMFFPDKEKGLKKPIEY